LYHKKVPSEDNVSRHHLAPPSTSNVLPHLLDAMIGGSITKEEVAQCHMTPQVTMLACRTDNNTSILLLKISVATKF